MTRIVIVIAALLASLSDAATKRSFYCNPGSTWTYTTVGVNEVVEVRSHTSTSNMYSQNMNCTLVLAAPSTSEHLTINLTAFKVVSPDYVMIYDGADRSVLIERWSGTYNSLQPGSNSYTTKLTSTITIYMWTNNNKQATGFIGDVYVSPGSIPITVSSSPSTSISSKPSSLYISSRTSSPSSQASPAVVLYPSSSLPLTHPGSWQSYRVPLTSPISDGSSSDPTSSPSEIFSFQQSQSAAPTPVLSISSLSSLVYRSWVLSTSSRATQNDIVINYLVGSQISALQISVPISISYGDADSKWIQGDFTVFRLSLASLLYCDPDRIQNVNLLPLSRLQSELQLLILSPHDVSKVAAMDLAVQFNNQIQNPDSDLRHVEVLNLAPDPPINITLKEILVTVCPNSTYAVEDCPTTDALVSSTTNSAIILPPATSITLLALSFCVITALIVYVRARKVKQYQMTDTQTPKGGDAINYDDAPVRYTTGTTGRRTKLSFAVPSNTTQYQVKRVAYDEMQMTLVSDEEEGHKYIKKRQASYHFGEADGNISALE